MASTGALNFNEGEENVRGTEEEEFCSSRDQEGSTKLGTQAKKNARLY